MQTIPGIKSILLCDKGTLAATPTTPCYVGIKESSSLKFSNYKTTKDVRGRTFRNKMLAELEFLSKQPTLKMLKDFFTFMNSNCDVQVVTEKQSFTANSEDVYKFSEATFLLGLGFEYSIDLEKRTLKGTLKGGADYDTAAELIDSADSASIVTVSGVTHPGGEDFALYRRSDFIAVQSPKTTVIFNQEDISDFKLSIASEGDENASGQIGVKDTLVKIEITGTNASVVKAVELMSKNINETVLIKLGNSGSYYDAFDFNAGVLTPVEEMTIGDDKAEMKVVFEGKVRPYEYNFLFGTAFGGAEADNGLNGGTVKLGY